MKRLLWGIIAVAVLWSGYWFIGAAGVRHGLEGWMQARRAEGWQADYADFAVRGFPNRFDATWDNLALADPDTGFAVDLPRFGLYALSWKPTHLIAVWPHSFTFRSPLSRHELASDDLRASLRVAPGPLLELKRAQLSGSNLRFSGDLPGAMDSLSLAMAQSDDDPTAYRLGLRAEGITLPEALTRHLAGDGSLPETISGLQLDADVTFARPWDLRALEEARPQPTAIDLHLARAAWGELMLQVTAQLEMDAQGIPSGTAQIQARNWRQMLQLAVRAGALDARSAEAAEKALAFLAGAGGNPEALDLKLTLKGGMVWAGLVPLGPAPAIRLR